MDAAAQQTEAYKKLNLHMSVYSDVQVARDVLVAYIMLSNDFNLANPTDMKYLWDVWFSAQWNESTRKRFVKDVTQLAEGKWEAYPIKVLDSKNAHALKVIFQEWLKISQNFPTTILEALADSRYSC